MSETQSDVSQKPTVTITHGDDGQAHAVVERGPTVSRFGVLAHRLHATLVSVLIDSFKMPQDEAEAHADAELSAQADRQRKIDDDARKVLDYDELKASLADSQKLVADLSTERDKAMADLKQSQAAFDNVRQAGTALKEANDKLETDLELARAELAQLKAIQAAAAKAAKAPTPVPQAVPTPAPMADAEQPDQKTSV